MRLKLNFKNNINVSESGYDWNLNGHADWTVDGDYHTVSIMQYTAIFQSKYLHFAKLKSNVVMISYFCFTKKNY